jgi:hypothetical protein
MTPVMLRQFWGLIETNQATLLLNLDDSSLNQRLLQQFRTHHALSSEESTVLASYIESRLGLIRDLAHDRLAPNALYN